MYRQSRTISKATKFIKNFVLGLTFGCLRSGKRMCSSPAALGIFSWSFATESGQYISPVMDEGSIYGFSGCFSCSWISRFTASWGMDTLRTEVSVLGWEMVSLPLGFLKYCLLTEIVRIKAIPEEGCQLALPQTAHQFQIEHEECASGTLSLASLSGLSLLKGCAGTALKKTADSIDQHPLCRIPGAVDSAIGGGLDGSTVALKQLHDLYALWKRAIVPSANRAPCRGVIWAKYVVSHQLNLIQAMPYKSMLA